MRYLYLIACCLLSLPLIGNQEHVKALTAITEQLSNQNSTSTPEQPSIAKPTAPPSLPAMPMEQEAPELTSATSSYESAFLKMILVLVGILVFVFIVFFLFKKFSSSRMQQSNHTRTIKILEKRAISPKSMLYLIEIGGQKILIAESQLEIRPISNLDWIENENKGL
ncbi:MAG: flagellar biosynthetic protein FliO [Chlamydiota bacterium]